MNAIVKSPQKDLAATILDMKGQIQAALPKHISADRIARIALTALRKDKKLGECRPETFLGALMIASQLGLEPNTPLQHCFLIAYKNDCQFQIGYQGLIDIGYRTGLYQTIYAEAVHEGDEFEYELGLNKTLKHIPKKGSKVNKAIAYYAVYKLKDGSFDFSVMFREEVEAHAKKYSKSYHSGPWVNNFDAMAKKTCIIKVLKYAPKSIELAQAISVDNAKITLDLKATEEEGDMVYETSFDDVSTDQNNTREDFAATKAGQALL